MHCLEGTVIQNMCGSLVSWAFSENLNAYTSYKQPWMQLSIYFRRHVYQIFTQMMSLVHTDALEWISHCLNCSCKVLDCSRKKHQRSHAVSMPTVCQNREQFYYFLLNKSHFEVHLPYHTLTQSDQELEKIKHKTFYGSVFTL